MEGPRTSYLPSAPKRRGSVKSIVTTVAVVALVLSACGGQSDSDIAAQSEGGGQEWGPVAVVPPQEGHGQALIHGTLRVTDDCVLLDEQGENALLVWPADRTTWNPEARTVTFENLDGEVVTVGDGDEVSMGGGGSSVDEGGVSNEEYISGREWVSPPDPSCASDVRWSVGDGVTVTSDQ